MAAHERLSLHTSIAHHLLTDQLAKVLTKGSTFKLYHVSTPPSRSPALYSAPPGERPERTYCESHFLAVSINTASGSARVGIESVSEVLVFGLEVLIYSTAFSSTFFVSKADSTGYLKLLDLPRGSPSPLKDISVTFLSYLIERRKRPSTQSTLSLFARAQGQYLFPGSSDNNDKHVLDDRGLIRWWCRVLDPLLETDKGVYVNTRGDMTWESIRGYLKVPGLDDHDVKTYLPRARGSSALNSWSVGHLLRKISRYNAVPPRCLIPRFPDDPKSRFLDELDDELSTSQGKAVSGEWRSVKTLDQFWEMMAFRQECSAGRLVGFIWIVFEPSICPQPEDQEPAGSQTSVASISTEIPNDEYMLPTLPSLPHATFTPDTSFAASSQAGPTSSLLKSRRAEPEHSSEPDPTSTKPVSRKKKKLSGPIIPRQPRIKTQNRQYSLERPERTPYYIWPPDGRGQIVLDEKDYSRMTELLLRLDFTNLDLAIGSTARWINEVRPGTSSFANATGTTSGSGAWGASVMGTKVFEVKSEDAKTGVPRTLNVGLVRKKRKVDVEG